MYFFLYFASHLTIQVCVCFIFRIFFSLPRWRVGSFQHNYIAGGGHVGACRKHAYVHERLMYMLLYDNTGVVLQHIQNVRMQYVRICSILLGAEAYAANTFDADLSASGYGRAVGWSIQRTRQHMHIHIRMYVCRNKKKKVITYYKLEILV